MSNLRLLYRPASADAQQAFAAAGRVSAFARCAPWRGQIAGSERQLVELKAVDDAYPLFGQVQLSPAGPLDAALAQRDGHWGAVADRESAGHASASSSGRS